MADRKKILIPLLVLALGIVLAFVLIASRPEVQKTAKEILPPNVRVLEAQPQDVPVTVHSQGTVVPRTQANLVSEVSGRIERVAPSFEAGGFVRHGQHLVWLDQRDYKVNVATQRASLAQAQVLLERERAEAEVARREWDSLKRPGTPSPLVLRTPQLQEAQARVDAAEAAVDRAELDLDRTIIRAPFTGRIRSKAVDRGGFVNRGTPIATIYSVDTAEIRLPIADSELAFIEGFEGGARNDGAPVSLEAEFAGEARTWEGTIVRTEGEIDPTTRMVTLVAAVNDPYGLNEPVPAPLGVGLFVNAEIEGKPLANAYRMPRRALRRDDQIAVVKNDRLELRTVRVVRGGEDWVIIDRGLEPGDKVVVSKLDIATEGMQVTPLPAEQESLRFKDDVLTVSTGQANLESTEAGTGDLQPSNQDSSDPGVEHSAELPLATIESNTLEGH